MYTDEPTYEGDENAVCVSGVVVALARARLDSAPLIDHCPTPRFHTCTKCDHSWVLLFPCAVHFQRHMQGPTRASVGAGPTARAARSGCSARVVGAGGPLVGRMAKECVS